MPARQAGALLPIIGAGFAPPDVADLCPGGAGETRGASIVATHRPRQPPGVGFWEASQDRIDLAPRQLAVVLPPGEHSPSLIAGDLVLMAGHSEAAAGRLGLADDRIAVELIADVGDGSI